MSLETVRKALEKRLATLTPAIAIAYENTAFSIAVSAPHLEVYLKPNKPDNSTMGQSTYFEIGFMQVTVCYPLNTGTANAGAKAQAIRNHFRRGTSMLESGVTVNVTDTPTIASGMVGEDKWRVPVTIYYQAQIST